MTWTKLRSGEWGIRSTVELRESVGQIVAVQKKSGGVSHVRIARLIWSGNGVWLYAIAQDGHAGRPSATSSSHAGEVRCLRCGQWTPEGDDWCMACGCADYER